VRTFFYCEKIKREPQDNTNRNTERYIFSTHQREHARNFVYASINAFCRETLIQGTSHMERVSMIVQGGNVQSTFVNACRVTIFFPPPCFVFKTKPVVLLDLFWISTTALCRRIHDVLQTPGHIVGTTLHTDEPCGGVYRDVCAVHLRKVQQPCSPDTHAG
jgi:hypothetical protein